MLCGIFVFLTLVFIRCFNLAVVVCVKTGGLPNCISSSAEYGMGVELYSVSYFNAPSCTILALFRSFTRCILKMWTRAWLGQALYIV